MQRHLQKYDGRRVGVYQVGHGDISVDCSEFLSELKL